MRSLLSTILALLALAALAGCSATGKAGVEPSEPGIARKAEPAPTMPPQAAVVPEQAPAPSPQGLEAFLRLTRNQQYRPPEGLYTPPPETVAGNLLVQVAMEPAELHLGTGITSYAASENGLAMGLENGEIRVYGDWPCAGVALPEKEPVSRLAWNGDSPYLAAAGPESRSIAVFDLRHCAQVKEVDALGIVQSLAVSPKGTYLAEINQGNTLYVGPAQGPLAKAAVLRFANLGLTFTPREGLLIAVDQAGWVLLFAPSKGQLVSRFQIPGGPFDAGFLAPPLVTLFPSEGEPVVWDLAEQAPAELRRKEPNRFELRNGVLFYTTRKPLPVKKVLLAAPAFGVDVCPDRNLVRVRDLDGLDRYYDLESKAQADPQECGSWTPVQADDQGKFCFGDVCGVLADRIYQSGHMRLMARRVPGAGYFLWWLKTPRPDEYNPLPGSLPERATISPDERLTWAPLAPDNTSY